MNRAKLQIRGFALVTAMIFLLVLTLVALAAVRGTTLELKMSANKAMRTEALEASESPRALVSRLVEAHSVHRGWPAAVGGSIADAEFGYRWPAGLALVKPGGVLRDWYLANGESRFDPQQLMPDVMFDAVVQTLGQTGYRLRSEVAVYKLRADLNPGAGAAMSAGYEGTGRGAAAGGAAVYYVIRSRGSDPGGQALSVTTADYRHVVRN